MIRFILATLALLPILPAELCGQERSSNREVRELISQLGDPSYENRERAELAILKIGKPAVPLLKGALDHDDPEVKKRVWTIMKAMPFRAVLGPRHARKFGPSSGLGRIRAIQETDLVDLDAAEGLFIADAVLEGFAWHKEYINSLHQEEVLEVRDRLWQGPVLLSWVFVRMMEHDHWFIRLNGVGGLKFLGGLERESFLARGLDDPNANVRRSTAQALAQVKAGKHAKEVEGLLQDPDPKVRWAAVVALRDITGAWETVVTALGDPDPQIRAKAAGLLADADRKDAVGPLKEALAVEKSPTSAGVLKSALRSLERLKGMRWPLEVLSSWSGPKSRIAATEFHRARTPEEYAEIWSRHSGYEAPPVDFSEAMLVVIFCGKRSNSRGIDVVALWEDDEKVVLQFVENSNQTKGSPDRVAPYGFFVIPASNKPIVIDENVQGLKGQPPIWKEVARLP